MNPCPGNNFHLWSSKLYANPKSWTLEGLFELTPRPSRALNFDAYVASKLQRYKETVRCGTPGAEIPGHRQEQLPKTLIVRLFITHLLSLLQK